MTKILQRIEVTLRSFYIFNSNFGQKEGEEDKKILFYHPNDIELNTKIKDVGLSEAIITFTGTFTSDNDCKALHTQKTTQLFYQPETGYWIVLVLNVPKEVKLKEGIEVTEYRGSDVSDRIYSKAVLRQCYHMFRLFAGTFQMHMNSTPNKETARLLLCESLRLFFDKYLLSLKLPNCNILNMQRTIQYLALDKALFLRAHNFISMIRATFGAIEETILLYNEQVVCSGQLDAEDLYSLHGYIVYNVLDNVRYKELGGAVLTRSSSSSSEHYQNGAFINCTDQQESEQATHDNAPKPLKVYIRRSTDSDVQPYYLIVYRALNATLCIFVNVMSTLPMQELYNDLHAYMGPQLSSLSRDIAEEFSSTLSPCALSESTNDTGSSNNMSPKYLFINEQSLKHHTNIITERGARLPSALHNIPKNVINLIADLATPSDGSDTVIAAEEVQLKTTNDYWIVRRRCNWRQYYVIFLNSKATLLDVTQEAKRIFEEELTDDVFFDK